MNLIQSFFAEIWQLLNQNIIGVFFGALAGFFSGAVLMKWRDRGEHKALLDKAVPLIKRELESNLAALEKLKEHLKGEVNDKIALLPHVFSSAGLDVASQGRFIETMEPTDAIQILRLREEINSANEIYHQLREHSLGVASALQGSVETRKGLVAVLKGQLHNIEVQGNSMLTVLNEYPNNIATK